jgi:purine-binding chemotaxis protein CheW
MHASRQLCTFHVADLYLGIDVLSVQEILRARELARIPLAPDTIEGLLNLRGQIVTAIDLRRRLGFPRRSADAESMFMIVRTVDGQVALVVDAVGDVLDSAADTFEPPPDTVPDAVRRLIGGVHKLPDRLLHVLDCEQATALAA